MKDSKQCIKCFHSKRGLTVSGLMAKDRRKENERKRRRI